MTTGASCCLLLWLQVFTAVSGDYLSSTAESWLSYPCKIVSDTGKLTHKWSKVGICECFHDETTQDYCFEHQIIYRAQASALLLFLLLIILCIGGCGKGGARYAPGGKFLFVICIFAVSLFLPNSYGDMLGVFARNSAVLFLVGQTVLVIDFAYRWNETWLECANEAYRRRLDRTQEKAWKCGIIFFSLVFAGFAFYGAVQLFILVELFTFRCVLVACLFLSLVSLFLSITILDNSGGLLCSCVVMAYIIFLCYEAAVAMPGAETGAFLPPYVGLSIAAYFLIEFTLSTRTQGGKKEFLGDQDEDIGHLDTWVFLQACIWHAMCCVFVSAKLTPEGTWTEYSVHCIGALLAVLIYGWTLAAPTIFPNRDFSGRPGIPR